MKGSKANTVIKSVVLKIKKIKTMPNRKKMSAMRFMIIAFKAALLAETLVNQKLISK